MSVVKPRRIGGYELLGPIAAGGMGAVYRVRRPGGTRELALKTIATVDAGALGAIRREIAALARLCHPGIVRIRDHGVDDGAPWYAMDLHRGVTLRQRLRMAAPLPTRPPEVPAGPSGPVAPGSQRPLRLELAALADLAATLSYLHGEGHVHGDLKPENLLLRPRGGAILIDFGLAVSHEHGRHEDASMGIRAALGTAPYVAPELWDGAAGDPRSDLYALGCILYEVITGAPPFVASAQSAMAELHRRTAPAPLSGLPFAVAPSLQEITLGLLAKDPRDRPAQAGSVLAALAAAGVTQRASKAPAARPYLLRPRLVGRDGLLATLRERLDDVRHGGLVILDGESGVGKSRIVAELAQAAARRRMLLLTGRCRPPAEDRAGALAVWREPLRQIADVCREGGETLRKAILGQRAAVLAPFEPSLHDLVPDGARLHDLPGVEGGRRLERAMVDTLLAVGRARPTVVLLDDLQWADRHGRATLDRLASRASLPLLVIAAQRPAVMAESYHQKVATHVSVPPLPSGDLVTVAAEMMGVASLSGPLARMLRRSSQGSPLLLAEMVRSAVQNRLLVQEPTGRWRPSRTLPRRLPSLESGVVSRVAALGADARAVLQLAAVVGVELQGPLLVRAAGRPEGVVLAALSELLRERLLEEEGVLYRFHHRIHEIVYGAIHAADRRRLHAAVAAAIASAPDADASMLAHHWDRAGRPSAASPLYLAAGREAVAKGDLHRAGLLLSRYLGLPRRSTPASIEVRNLLGSRVLAFLGDAARARREHHLALSEATAMRDVGGQIESLRGLAALARTEGRTAAAHRYLARALELARLHGGPEPRLLSAMGNLHNERGRTEEARRWFERALERATAEGNAREAAIALGSLATVYKGSGDGARAVRALRKAIAASRAAGARHAEGTFAGNLANLLYERGQLRQARRLYRRALRIHREIGLRRMEGAVLGNLGMVESARRPRQARRLLEQALSIHRETGYRLFEAHTMVALGDLESRQGNERAAEALYEGAATLARTAAAPLFEGTALVGLARLCRRRGRFRQAERMLSRAERLLAGNRAELARAIVERGHLAVARQRSVEAHLRRLARIRAELGLRAASPIVKSAASLAAAARALRRELFHGELVAHLPPSVRRAATGN